MTRPRGAGQWLFLLHQLPAHPAYERVKLHRRLQSIGAVAVKKTVYALPATEEALEDFLWTAKEVEAAGGEAVVCRAELVHGIDDGQLRQLFDAARDAEYRELAQEVRSLASAPADGTELTRSAVSRFRKRLAEIVVLDFFAANGRAAAETAVADLEAHLMRSAEQRSKPAGKPARTPRDLRGKIWVTRRNVHVDRIACAWLVRKFIDSKARFKFVDPSGYAPRRNELRFDMADAEFTHRSDACSFEVLLAQSGRRDPALQAIAEIVHDLDLKDGKFGRPEAEGVRQLLSGITLATDDDKERLERGATLFEDLYRSLQRRPGKS
jgi:hypothetical protein